VGELGTGIQYLPGVGPKRAALIQRELGVSTLGELIRIYPFRYIDRSSITRIADMSPDLAYVQVKARVLTRNLISIKHLSVIVDDGSGTLELVFFKGVKWTFDKLVPGAEFLFFGKPQLFNGRLNMVHPEVDAPQSGSMVQGGLTGVYPSTEKLKNGGVTGKVMCKLQSAALSLCLQEIRETMPAGLLSEMGLCSLQYALKNVHFPLDGYALQKAVRRLKFEELFFLQLSLLKQKYVRTANEKGIVMSRVGPDFHACYNALPYSLTGAQQRVIKEIRSDMSGGHQMNRLLQGDVGSGKTMVAVLSCLIAIGNGCQACIMAPTEVLARQHYENICKYLAPTRCAALCLRGAFPRRSAVPCWKALQMAAWGS